MKLIDLNNIMDSNVYKALVIFMCMPIGGFMIAQGKPLLGIMIIVLQIPYVFKYILKRNIP